ncbi:MAG: GMC family oxidoreductase, partial [Deltaproteobacteria bacterium]
MGRGHRDAARDLHRSQEAGVLRVLEGHRSRARDRLPGAGFGGRRHSKSRQCADAQGPQLVSTVEGEVKAAIPGRPVLKVTQPSDIPDAGLDLQADVVIIGSGASGAVAAYELSRSGAKVVVLEAGPYIPSSEFQEHLPTSGETLYEENGYQVNTTGDLAILQG